MATEKIDPQAVRYDTKWKRKVYDRIAALKHKPPNEAHVVECDHEIKESDLRKIRLYVLARARKGEFGFKVTTKLRLKKLYIWRTK